MNSIKPHENLSLRDADGIVVLTGGSLRITAGMDLLEANKADRLLITGVNQITSMGALVAQNPQKAALFACCVDIDRKALNTIGNALETANWADEKGYKKLIVVTSNYHLPRSLIEISRRSPHLELLPYPVFPNGSKTGDWFHGNTNWRVLLTEYLKYVATIVRYGISDSLRWLGL